MRYHQKPSSLSRHRRLMPVVFSLIAVLLLACGITLYALKIGPFEQQSAEEQAGTPTNNIDYNPPTPEQIAAGNAAKEQSTTGSGGSDQSPPPTASTNSSKAGVGMEITATNIDNQSGVLRIRTLIQTITSTGTCTLTMSGPNGASYSATSETQAGPSTSTCKGFDVPISSLPSGSWSIRVSFENESLQASTTTEKSL